MGLRSVSDDVRTPNRWADEKKAGESIRAIFERHRYVIDTHTAVAAAVEEELHEDGVHTIIDATASPYKFGADVLAALGGPRNTDDFACIERLSRTCGRPMHRALAGLREKPVRHTQVIAVDQIRRTVLDICDSIQKKQGCP